jgi:protein TonB
MSDKYIEKAFIYLLVISVALHIGLFALIYYLPHEQQPPPKEPVFLDLQNMPALKPQPSARARHEATRAPAQPTQVKREPAPPNKSPHGAAPVVPRESVPRQTTSTLPPERREAPITPGSSVSSLLRPRQRAAQGPLSEGTNLFPIEDKLAKLEEEYRRKHESEVSNEESELLDPKDPSLASFYRRLEQAIYGVWRVPNNAVPGAVTFLVTFSGEGLITDIQKIESSGFRNLDDAAYNAMRTMGPLGSLPRELKNHDHKLFMTFIYGQSFFKIVR